MHQTNNLAHVARDDKSGHPQVYGPGDGLAGEGRQKQRRKMLGTWLSLPRWRKDNRTRTSPGTATKEG